ncbi:MAG: ribonuclease HII [Acidobacteria bacterium]|nr:ribonuclease HII [Acidobacteriota bacterium]
MATIAELFGESLRLRWLRGLEAMLGSAGYERVAGVDEVGRGSLAGPVVAAAVIPAPDRVLPGVDDSKKLSSAQRRSLSEAILRTSIACTVVEVSPQIIDEINILEATKRAMTGALASLDPEPDCALVDAVALRGFPFPCLPLVKADALSYSVACASIVAKVARDCTMEELHADFPHYDFATNKGYGAPAHLRALEEFGPSPVHRLSFRSVLPRRRGEA